jgi:hypothetical protein
MPSGGSRPARKARLWQKISLPGDNKMDRRGIAHIDARTKLGRIHKAFERALYDHFGGKPDIIELGLIKRVNMLHIKCLMLDQKIADGRDLNENEERHYLAWSNALCRTLQRLRFKDTLELDLMKANASYTRSLR